MIESDGCWRKGYEGGGVDAGRRNTFQMARSRCERFFRTSAQSNPGPLNFNSDFMFSLLTWPRVHADHRRTIKGGCVLQTSPGVAQKDVQGETERERREEGERHSAA